MITQFESHKSPTIRVVLRHSCSQPAILDSCSIVNEHESNNQCGFTLRRLLKCSFLYCFWFDFVTWIRMTVAFLVTSTRQVRRFITDVFYRTSDRSRSKRRYYRQYVGTIMRWSPLVHIKFSIVFHFSLRIFNIERCHRWLLHSKHDYLPELIFVSTSFFSSTPIFTFVFSQSSLIHNRNII